jgi:hypothetical protein
MVHKYSHAIHEVPLHDLKVGVWHAIRAHMKTEAIFFHKTIPKKITEIGSVTLLWSADRKIV